MPIAKLGARVCLPRDLNGAGRDPDLLFFGQAEDVAARRAVNQVPERHAAAIALNDLLDEIRHQAADCFAVSLPERRASRAGLRSGIRRAAPPRPPARPGAPTRAENRARPSDTGLPREQCASTER